MNKRIFRSMCLLVLLTVLFFAALWGAIFSRQFETQARDGLKNLRVSVMDEVGTVFFDNRTDPALLDNHLNRPEVLDAVQNGSGESERFSATLRETTYYYAVRLANGNILRLALTTDSVAALLSRFIPVVMLCLTLAAAFAFAVARRLTRGIVAPINSMNLDDPKIVEYEELLPFLKKIETQKKELLFQHWELENRSATIAAITKNMREGLLLLDEEGTVLLANQSVAHILGAREIVGKKVIELCRDLDFLEQVKNCLSGKEAESILPTGSSIYSVFYSPVYDGDTVSGGVVLLIDITQKYAAQEQRKEFSANVSHELKTPLTTIAALSEMMADGTAKEKDIRSFADKIHRQAKRLIGIIGDIIKLSEFDEGGAVREFTSFDLYEVAETVFSGLSEAAAERGVSVGLQGDCPCYLTGNLRMLDELLYNLVDNAIKYNRPGGSAVVTLSRQGEEVAVTVTDTGIGIAREQLDRIFERFYRVDKSRSKKTGGTGLGLSIVKHIVEYHGGRVEVQSREGEGTTFTCWLKRHPPAEPEGLA